MKKGLIVVLMLSVVSAVSAAPFGLWEFNDAGNLTAATIGSDLGLTGSVTAETGIGGSDGAAFVGQGSFLSISGMGSGTGVWSMLMDIKVPRSTIGKYQALYQTQGNNGWDAECFIHKTTSLIGNYTTGYSANPVAADTWYRVIFTWDVPNAAYNLYLDGVNSDNNLSDADISRYVLNDVILLFADDDGEDPGICVSNVAFWTSQLSAADAAALGVAGDVIPEPATICLLGLGAIGLLRRKNNQ